MKTTLQNFLVAICVLFNVTAGAQNTLHSTPVGGYWADPATWVEGTVPTAIDSVVISSPVNIGSYSNLCSSMLVTETGFVGWGSGGGNIIVNGSIYNHGSIGTGMYMLFGDIVNDSVFGGIDAVVKFRGSSHSITCSAGKSIDVQFIAEDSLQHINLNSDLEIINKASILGNSEVFTNNHVLRVNGGSLQDCRIHAFDTLLFNSMIGSLTISGDYKLKGTMDILGNLYLEEEGVNYGTIRSLYGMASDLHLDGNFVNEGTIDGSTAGNLNVNVLKGAANHGIWNANVTRFLGSEVKHISQSPGHPFGGTQVSTDNSGSVIYLDSDVEFTAPNILLNNYTLNCGTHLLTANCMFDHGSLISESEIEGNSDFWETNFEGGLRFSGNNRFSNCISHGNVENSGHMQDVTFYGGIFRSYGFLDNKSSITGIHFNIYGNLCNTGTVTDNCIVDVVGDTTQYILLTNAIESQCNFYSDLTGNSYQWLLNGAEIPNQLSQYLFFNSLQLTDAGVYRCRVTTESGTQYSRDIIVNNITGQPETAGLPLYITISPNPFTSRAIVRFEITEASRIQLRLSDLQGRLLKVLEEGTKLPGSYESVIEDEDLPRGFYLVELETKCTSGNARHALKILHP